MLSCFFAGANLLIFFVCNNEKWRNVCFLTLIKKLFGIYHQEISNSFPVLMATQLFCSVKESKARPFCLHLVSITGMSSL